MPNLYSLIQEASRRLSNKTAILEISETGSERHISYQELNDSALYVSTYLRGLGVSENTSVVICSENSIEWIIFWLAINALGAVAVPIDPNVSPDELKIIVDDCDAKAVFISKKKSLTGIQADRNNNYIVIEDIKCYKNVTACSVPLQYVNEVAALIYTSGTTGNPKAVILTNKNYLANLHSIQKLAVCRENDVFLSILPFYHSFPFMVNLLLPLATGATNVILTSLNPAMIIDTLREKKITIVPSVPRFFSNVKEGLQRKIESKKILNAIVAVLKRFNLFMRTKFNINLGRVLFYRLHRSIAPALRYFVSGGARLDPDVFNFYYSLGFNILEGYGLTEAAPVVSLNIPGKEKAGSIGIPIPNVDIKLLFDQESEYGELLVKGNNVMAGYYKNKKLTNEVVIDGWLRTGDLAKIEKDGSIFIVGRKKEVIVLSNGKNIYPDEIEPFFKKISGIEDCVLIPDDNNGNITLALLVKLSTSQDETSIDDIKSKIITLSKNLPDYKQPKRIYFTSKDYPKTNLGKPQRFKIGDFIDANISGKKQKSRIDILPDDIFDRKILELLKHSITEQRDIHYDSDLFIDLGIDSLRKVDLLVTLEDFLSVALPEDFFNDIRTVKDLVHKIRTIIRTDNLFIGEKKGYSEMISKLPPEHERSIFVKRGGFFMRGIETIVFLIIKLSAKLFFKISVVNAESIKESDVFILAPNHTSYLDGYLIASILPWRIRKKFYFVGLSMFFDHYPLKIIKIPSGILSFDPDIEPIKSLRLSLFALKNNYPVCIFPEGGRSADGELQKLKTGIAVLAEVSHVPVYPVVIKGAFKAWPKTRRLPKLFSKIEVVIEAPITYERAGVEESRQQFLELLRERLQKHLN